MNNIRAGYKVNELGEIPNDWDVNSLEEISRITRLAGAEYSDIWETDDEGTIIALRGYNIGQNKLILNDIETISESMSNRLIRSKLFKGDIVFPCVGTIGKATVISEDNKYHINQNIAKITSNDNINSIYISYFLMSDFTQKQIFKYNTSSSQPNVLVGNLRRFIVNIPPLKEQEKIATILSTVDEQIDNVDVLIEKNKELKKGLMQKLLTKGIGHTEFKKTEIGEIPVEWTVNSLAEITEVIMGQSPDSSSYNVEKDGVAFFQGKSEFGRMYPIVKKWCNKPTKISKPLDILISVRAPVGDVNINNEEACIGRGLGAVRQTDKSNYGYIYYILQKYKKTLEKSAQGSTFEAISSGDLKGLKIPICNIKEQKKIADILSTVDEQIEECEKKKIKLEEIKKGLMQQLLTGKIRVSY